MTSGKSRVDLVVGSLTIVGMEALRSDICVGLTPDQGKLIRYQAIVIAAMTETVPPRLHAILDGQPEGIMHHPVLTSSMSFRASDRSVARSAATSWQASRRHPFTERHT